MNVALLTAAGSGTRMQLNIPKQFIHVDDKPIIIYTMEAFQNHPSIDAIIVVTIDSWSDVLWAYAKQFGITKLKWVVPGGDSGQESIRKGLDVLKRELTAASYELETAESQRRAAEDEVLRLEGRNGQYQMLIHGLEETLENLEQLLYP